MPAFAAASLPLPLPPRFRYHATMLPLSLLRCRYAAFSDVSLRYFADFIAFDYAAFRFFAMSLLRRCRRYAMRVFAMLIDNTPRADTPC